MKVGVLVIVVFLLCGVSAVAQGSMRELCDSSEKMGGVYYAYPVHAMGMVTRAPKGYLPFYISHYGRHGSRYLIGDGGYKWVLNLLDDAQRQHALTGLGRDVLTRLRVVWNEARGRGGALTPLGVRQQRGIAERMYQLFPQVFDRNLKISARSTIVVRCVLSMDAFCERLKEIDPSLRIDRESCDRYMSYLNYHTSQAVSFCSDKGPWREEYNKFEQNHVHPQRLTMALFSDSTFIVKRVNPATLMWNMYEITVDMQNMESRVSFYDVWTKQELFDLWQCVNLRSYICDATSPLNNGMMVANAKPLLQNVLDDADSVISIGGKGVTLRFGHDGNIIPFVALLRFKDCFGREKNPNLVYRSWSNYKIVPMAANVQMVFFRKKGSGDVLVKFMLNERETTIPSLLSDSLPYYHWRDVRQYFKTLL